MKIVFMGTPDFSVPTLKALTKAEYEILGVVTQPDKPYGRGKKVKYSPVKLYAMEQGLQVYQPKKVREQAFIDNLKKLNPDIIVVIAFGQILPEAILQLPKYGCINVHASLLPKYRGAAPIQWSIINGETHTGITTMHMDKGLDTGDMILKDKVMITEQETAGLLHDKLSKVGADLLIKTLKTIEEGTAPREKQQDEAATYAPMLDKHMGNIDWNMKARSIEQLIRGLNPWPSAFTYWHKKMIKIWKAEVIKDFNIMGNPGEVVEIIKNKGPIVQCGENRLLITELQLQGKKRITADAFLRGHSIALGELFTSF